MGIIGIGMLGFLAWSTPILASAWAQESDTWSLQRRDWEWTEGRDPNRLVVKFTDDSGITLEHLPPEWEGLFVDATTVFSQSSIELERTWRQLQKSHPNISDLRTYVYLEWTDPAAIERIALQLKNDPRIEHLYRAFAHQDPPSSVSVSFGRPPSETPDFFAQQRYFQPAPVGFGFEYAESWTRGSGIRIVDIEYAWDPTHEDLQNGPQEHAWGWNYNRYQYHGNAVLGQLVAGDNGYGVRGTSLDAEVLMVSPFPSVDNYNVADAILSSADFLTDGDVILIEQQFSAFGNYCPVEVDPSVFDAIQWVVAQNIVVVEPGGNGSQDLDDPQWGGWFDRSVQDSTAIMVGGGTVGNSFQEPWEWAGGSSYGSRIDVQGWYEQIVTVGGEGMADLYLPNQNLQQAYTGRFGGTSGASPQVVSVVAAMNSLSIERYNQPWKPLELRTLLSASGQAQPFEDAQQYWIGPMPNLQQLLWYWGM